TAPDAHASDAATTTAVTAVHTPFMRYLHVRSCGSSGSRSRGVLEAVSSPGDPQRRQSPAALTSTYGLAAGWAADGLLPGLGAAAGGAGAASRVAFGITSTALPTLTPSLTSYDAVTRAPSWMASRVLGWPAIRICVASPTLTVVPNRP